MLHHAMYCPKQAHLQFWPQAIEYSVWVFNRLSNVENELTPNELWSSVQNSGNKLARTHVFGCPVYVLDAAIQDVRKIPKWNPRERLGLFLGFSERHSSQVPLVLNVKTGKISPQHHIIFDSKFKTVHLLPDNYALEKQWTITLRLGHKSFLNVDFDNNGNPIVSPMSELIKAYSKEKQRRLNDEDITAIDREEYSTNNQIYDHKKIQAEIPLPLQPEIPPPLAKDT